MFQELKTLYSLFLSYTTFYFWNNCPDYSICYVVYSICNVYKNNGNIQNAINTIITYVGKFWKVEYTRLQAITICVKTVRVTRAPNILLLRQEVYLRIRDHSLLTIEVFQFIQFTGVLTSM